MMVICEEEEDEGLLCRGGERGGEKRREEKRGERVRLLVWETRLR